MMQSWASMRSCMQKREDNMFLKECYTALWCHMRSSLIRCGWLVLNVPEEAHVSLNQPKNHTFVVMIFWVSFLFYWPGQKINASKQNCPNFNRNIIEITLHCGTTPGASELGFPVNSCIHVEGRLSSEHSHLQLIKNSLDKPQTVHRPLEKTSSCIIICVSTNI